MFSGTRELEGYCVTDTFFRNSTAYLDVWHSGGILENLVGYVLCIFVIFRYHGTVVANRSNQLFPAEHFAIFDGRKEGW